MLNPLIGDEKLNGLIERYMDDETTRLICFFIKRKFNPEDPCCKGCARFALCLRDAMKGNVPWLKEDIDDLIEKLYGHQRCRNCDV